MDSESKTSRLLVGAAHLAANPRQLAGVPRWLENWRTHPLDARLPWWPYGAQDHVAARLPRGPVVLEFGGGGSTLWLVDRGADVLTVEHDEAWAEVLRQEVGDRARIELRPPSGADYGHYVAAAEQRDDDSCDLVVVDGRARVACTLAARAKVRPGGLLLLDDSDRPRYSRVHQVLSRWEPEAFRGFKPGTSAVAQSTVWRRPSA